MKSISIKIGNYSTSLWIVWDDKLQIAACHSGDFVQYSELRNGECWLKQCYRATPPAISRVFPASRILFHLSRTQLSQLLSLMYVRSAKYFIRFFIHSFRMLSAIFRKLLNLRKLGITQFFISLLIYNGRKNWIYFNKQKCSGKFIQLLLMTGWTL